MFADEDHVKYILGVYRAFYELRSFMEVTDELNDLMLNHNDGNTKVVNEILWQNSEKKPERTCFLGKKNAFASEVLMAHRLI